MTETTDKPEEANNTQNNSIHNTQEVSMNKNTPQHGEEVELQKKEPFYYFDKAGDSNPFNLDKDIMEPIFNQMKGKYKCAICILLTDDSYLSSVYLDATIKGIINNELCLKDFGISFNDIIIFIFVDKIKNNYLIQEEEKSKFDNQNQYLLINKKLTDNQNLNICLICNNTFLYTIECLKIYYTNILPLIRDNERRQTMFSIILTAGVVPQKDSFKILIKYAFNDVKDHGISVAPVEISTDNLISRIYQYEKVHFNIYNMSVYGATASVPISSLFSVFTITDKIQQFLNDYYLIANNKMSIDYHDYNLSLFLHNRKIPINFFYDEALGIIPYKDMEYSQYIKDCVNRDTGYYGNFFDILKTFINCKNSFSEKIFMFFQLVSIAIEFIYPALSAMTIYIIIYEGFGAYDYKPSIFFTSLYLIMMTASGFCSLISKDPYQMKLTNYFLYFFMEVFYAFVILTSVAAMDNVNKNKTFDKYKFNKAAAACIIILTFIPYVIPMIIKNSSVIKNILSMLLYLLLGASCSTSNFYMAKIFNAPDVSGGENIILRKGVYILIYVLFNLFFGILGLYNTNRTKRVNCVMGFGILFLLYNFFKIIGIISKLIFRNNKRFEDPKFVENLRFELNVEGSYEERKEIVGGEYIEQPQADYNDEKLDEEENDHSRTKSENDSKKNEEVDGRDVEVNFDDENN